MLPGKAEVQEIGETALRIAPQLQGQFEPEVLEGNAPRKQDCEIRHKASIVLKRTEPFARRDITRSLALLSCF